jgi:hypothetical protein
MALSAGTRTEQSGVQRGRLASLFTAVSLMVAGAACSADETTESPVGVYVGFNRGDRLLRFEEELGAPVQLVVTMADSRSPEAMNSSVYGQFAAADAYLPDLSDRLDVVASVPLAFGAGGMARTEEGRAAVERNLRATAAGRHDDDFRLVAEYLVDAGYDDAVIRLGHEFDGDWAPYSARGNADAYIAAFRHVHDVMTAVSPEFRFDWTSMVPYFVEHGPVAYPGDDVVDVIGIDAYWRDVDPIDDSEWDQRFEPALQAHLEFARERGKPVSYPEWGRSLADHPRFVELMHGWFSQLPSTGPGSLAYQAYFNEPGLADDEFYPYDLDQLPNVKSRYLELFGEG